jgi:2-iminobutanoate/2-iminopropanoate deaminase
MSNILKEKTPNTDSTRDNYLFFSSLELIDYFCNNLVEKDIKTQTKRIFEMARVFMGKKDFCLEDIYSILVMVRDMEQRAVVNEVFRLYFKGGKYPIRVFVQISDLETTADVEMEFSAFRGEKQFVNTDQGHLPTGPFSQAVVLDGYVHCSGVRPLDPASQKLVGGDFKQRTRQCLQNLEAVLQPAGTGLKKAYSFMVYLKDLEQLTQVEEVFAEYFSEQEDIIQEVTEIDQLNEGHDIEISCSAYL